MPSVRVRDTEQVEHALRRFKRICEKVGIISDIRKREHFEKPTEVRKRKKAAARKRWMKRLVKESPEISDTDRKK